MEAGKYDRSIRIGKYSVTPNEVNEDVLTFNWLSSRPASISPISDGERFRSDELGSQAAVRFRTRWDSSSSTINTKDKILCEEKEYEILGVKEIGRRKEVEITAVVRSD